jgi:hypothetical protein
MRYFVATAIGALAMALLLPGCGPGIGDVSGVVKFQGKPLEGGTITFYDEQNGVRSSAINADGAYAVTKVATGAAKIAVVAPMDMGLPLAKVTPLPAKYADRDQSGLRCNVAGGAQKHNVELDGLP